MKGRYEVSNLTPVVLAGAGLVDRAKDHLYGSSEATNCGVSTVGVSVAANEVEDSA